MNEQVQHALRTIDNALASLQINRQGHAVLQQSLQIVVAELNAGEAALKQIAEHKPQDKIALKRAEKQEK